jgi:hypothetical protein
VIDKLMRARVVVGIAATVLLASGVAFAASDGGSRPSVSQDEVSTTSTTVDSTTSTSVDDSSTSTTATTEAPTTSTTVAPNGSTTTTAPSGEHPENHGACVSAAAHDTPPGPGHGKAVSSVAHSDCGKTPPSTTATTETENDNTQGDNDDQGQEQHGSDHGNSGQKD